MLFCQLAGDFVSLWCIYIQGVEYGVQLTAIFEQKEAARPRKILWQEFTMYVRCCLFHSMKGFAIASFQNVPRHIIHECKPLAGAHPSAAEAYVHVPAPTQHRGRGRAQAQPRGQEQARAHGPAPVQAQPQAQPQAHAPVQAEVQAQGHGPALAHV